MSNKLRLGRPSAIYFVSVILLVFSTSDGKKAGLCVTQLNEGLPVKVVPSNQLPETMHQMVNKIPTQDELNKMFEEAKNMGAYIVRKPLQHESKMQTERQPFRMKPSEESLGGGFNLILAIDPVELNERTDRRLEEALYGGEWSALFFDVLGCPRPRPYVPEEDINEWMEERRLNFQRAIPDYPMLGRILDPYSDVWYSQQEVQQLRSECMTVQSRTKDTSASQGLRKLILACDKALESGLGLLLVGD
jgi:hypothetical protein